MRLGRAIYRSLPLPVPRTWLLRIGAINFTTENANVTESKAIRDLIVQKNFHSLPSEGLEKL